MDYVKKFILGDLVEGMRTFNGEIIEGEFNGFHLFDKLDPTSVIGVICVENDRCYNVVAGSIKLLESEDDRIRKKLIDETNTLWANDASPWPKTLEQKDRYVSWLEKQGEQKQFDDVIPKFKVGDFILNGDITNKGKPEIFKILKVCSSWYDVENIYDGRQTMITFTQEYTCRLWTIQDAKDGDVLASNNGCPFVYKKSDGTEARLYCCVSIANNFCIDDGIIHCGPKNSAKPATKEQCDLLFTKMKEDGYEWDAEKKEFKKIKKKSVWSKEDEVYYDYLSNYYFYCPVCRCIQYASWITNNEKEDKI